VIVAHVGSIGGGAGAAALKVHRALRESGVTSRFFAVDAMGAAPDDEITRFPMRHVASWNSPRSLLFRLAIKTYNTRRPVGAGLFSYTSLPVDSPFPFDLVRPDVIHLHWVAQGIDYRTFFDSIPSSVPVVWTLHDMEPFTGGCHYAGACVRYQRACGNCPQLNALRNPADLSAITFRRKKKRYARLNLTVVAVATANLEEARRAPLFADAREFTVIPVGIDTAVFTPRDRSTCREQLGLSTDRIVVAFGAVDLGSVYKGFSVLLDALARLRNRDRVLLLLFGGPLPPNVSPPGAWHHAGFVRDPERLSTIYSAADVYVLPSLSEALGQVGLEALACGTPVVGSRVGGVPDYVLDRKTGLLFDAGKGDDLAATLDLIIDHPADRLQYGRAGPALVREHFSVDVVNRSYLALYERLTMKGAEMDGRRKKGLGR
jgi:glycosyltransferase involved in cell wall biosynthesis